MYEIELHWKDIKLAASLVQFPIVEETLTELRLIKDDSSWTVVPKASLRYYEITVIN